LVYLRSRRKTEEIARALNNKGIKARAYHAGILAVDRARIQNEWMRGSVQVMVATNAFGMGIDKGDVRYVVHLDLPDDLESYYQEAGRAGRDGQKSFAVLLYDNADLTNLSERVEASIPTVETVKKVYHYLANMFQLAVGSGKDETFVFSIDQFVTYSKINANDIMQAFRWLERLDYLKFNAAMFERSRVQIKVSYNALYEFQLKNERCEHVIKWMLRYLGGDIYNNMIFVSEEKVAKGLQVSKAEVIRLLEFMQKAGILFYARTIEQPSVTYLQER
jgi:ATP-dependent DNA helicase RecQ